MDAKLVAVSGTTKATEVALRLPAVLGRGRDASVMLPHPLVSRRHCEIFEDNGYLVVRDMGSLNGTYIDNKRITEAVLPPGGTLTLGSVTFRADYQVGGSAASPPSAAARPADEQAAPAPSEPPSPDGAAADGQAATPGAVEFEGFEIDETPAKPRRPKPGKKPAQQERGEPPTAAAAPAKPAPAAEPGKSLDDDLADFLSDID
jgi:pSer/pThr/pTyr-binding forkhead associated (FHA) protein